ncbi:UV-damage endonuclease [Aspergillus luchuensis]|uniref:UV-damage endonuclease n=1 Tax=Aspergillus kawachii TaxID=1069201 RepID=A0A146G2D3_ASPKA|nr:UV-damage endonuclease [Aspergillus luchuensis]
MKGINCATRPGHIDPGFQVRQYSSAGRSIANGFCSPFLACSRGLTELVLYYRNPRCGRGTLIARWVHSFTSLVLAKGLPNGGQPPAHHNTHCADGVIRQAPASSTVLPNPWKGKLSWLRLVQAEQYGSPSRNCK